MNYFIFDKGDIIFELKSKVGGHITYRSYGEGDEGFYKEVQGEVQYSFKDWYEMTLDIADILENQKMIGYDGKEYGYNLFGFV